MADDFAVSLFVGPAAALRPIVGIASSARIFALMPRTSLLVLPLCQEVRDQLHMAHGTGEWLTTEPGYLGAGLTTTDLAFAARASAGSALAWIATAPSPEGDGRTHEGAAVWIDGAVAMRPTLMPASERRPRKLWPVNMALRSLGVDTGRADAGTNESDVFGLARFQSNDAIRKRALAVQL